ncbi:MAG: hypothetical protein IPM52_10585 [Bacteroidetes bacterium]|nr:hypothetical protein [Bacteroidota bacterium]
MLPAQSWYTTTGSVNESMVLRQLVIEGRLPAEFSPEIRPWPVHRIEKWVNSLQRLDSNNKGIHGSRWLAYENAYGQIQNDAQKKASTKWKPWLSNPARFAEAASERTYVAINPGFDFSLGLSHKEQLPLFVNHRMLEVKGHIAKKIGFYSRVDETQLRAAVHEQEFFNKWQVYPGAHLVKPYRTRGYDFLTSSGYLVYSPLEEVTIQFGQDKNFIGNGMRSLLLSDFATPYPFLKIHTRVGKFDYVNMYARLTDRYTRLVNPWQHALLPAKYYAMHYLAFQPSTRFRAGLFEAAMFHDNNGTGKGFDISYLNPVILYRAIEHQRGDPDKMTVGVNAQYLFGRGLECYGQFLLNEFRFYDLIRGTGSHANKFGWQAGLRYASDDPIRGLELQAELNRIRPYTYAHYTISGTYPVNSYSHQNQPLAHPLGANLNEWLLMVSFMPLPRFHAGFIGQYAFYGADSAGSNWGGNIFLDYHTYERETGNRVGQGVKTRLINANAWISYELRHALYLSLEARLRRLRSQIPQRNTTDAYLGLALRLNLPAQHWHY